jgi:hypothetical protein
MCSVLVPVCLLASAAIPILPLVGISMTIWLGVGSLILVLDLLARTHRATPRWRRWIMFPIQMASVFWFPLMLLAWLRNQSGFDWFLRGHEPGLAIAMIIGGIGCYALFVRKTCRVHVEFQEAGMGTPPLGLSPSQGAACQAQVVWRQQRDVGAQSSWWNRLDRRLARAIEQSRRPGWRRRSNLWIAGNALNGKNALVCCLVMCVVTGVGSIAPEIWKGMDFEFSDFFTNTQGPPSEMNLMMFHDFWFAFLGLIWRGRRRLLAIESLRPVSRRQLVLEMMTAFAWDCAPMACFYVVVVAALTYLANPQNWTPVWTVSLAVYLAAHGALACGIISWLNTIRRGWVTALAGFVIGCLFLFAGIGSAMMFLPTLGTTKLPSDLPNVSHWLLLGVGLVWGLVAWAVIAYAFRRWMKVELGDCAG